MFHRYVSLPEGITVQLAHRFGAYHAYDPSRAMKNIDIPSRETRVVVFPTRVMKYPAMYEMDFNKSINQVVGLLKKKTTNTLFLLA